MIASRSDRGPARSFVYLPDSPVTMSLGHGPAYSVRVALAWLVIPAADVVITQVQMVWPFGHHFKLQPVLHVGGV